MKCTAEMKKINSNLPSLAHTYLPSWEECGDGLAALKRQRFFCVVSQTLEKKNLLDLYTLICDWPILTPMGELKLFS